MNNGSNAMNTIVAVLALLGGAVIVGLCIAVAISVPGLARYMRMRRM